MARSRAGTRDESKVTRSNSLHIMSIPARSFGQLDSKTEYLSVARGAVLLYSGKTRPRAPISMVHGSCHHFSPCARMIVKFISGVIYGTVRNYLPCWANRGELVLASYVTSVTMPEIQPQSLVPRERERKHATRNVLAGWAGEDHQTVRSSHHNGGLSGDGVGPGRRRRSR